MSTSVTHVNPSSSWKQEVNRRVAAHMNRKPSLAAEDEAAQENRPIAGSRAAQAAARVAARYANAPSYSEMLANEARAVVQAAEAAARAALEAQAAAQSVLDSLEAVVSAESVQDQMHRTASVHIFPGELADGRGLEDQESEPIDIHPDYRIEQPAFPALELPQPAASRSVRPAEGEPFAILWEPDLPVRRAEPVAARARHGEDLFDVGIPDWPETGSPAPDAEDFEMVEPAQPIHANLIEFPRELVATRKVRPRLVEGPLAAGEQGSQLSIFEVDPGAISLEPEPVHVVIENASPAWNAPEWSGIRLDAQPAEELLPEPPPEVRSAPGIELAPASRRLLAVVVDAALITGALMTAGFVAASKSAELPGLRTIEIGSACALLIAGALYLALFFTLAKATPGMKYAQIGLRTFEGQVPTRAQRGARLGAMLLSVLPVGLGLGWAIFDDDHLTWHDRLSRTYLRRY